MFRKIGFGAAALMTALTIGCSDDKTTITGGQFRPGNFPGGSIDQNNLADDQRAFSNAGQGLADFPQLFWNVSNGHAIATFVTEPQNQGQILYVAHFNGSTWSAPVELRGLDADHSGGPAIGDVRGVKVLWLNTAGATTPTVVERDGDAIVLFTRGDEDPNIGAGVTNVDEDNNRRLYGSYFNVSEINALATTTTQGGFQTLATPIDFDNQISVLDTDVTGDDDNDPNVTGFGFASDSLHGTHQQGGLSEAIDSGDPTTFVHILYRKDPTSGDPTPADIEGLRWWSVQFDLAQVGDAMPTADASSVIDLPGGLDGVNAEGASANIIVHNGHVFWNVDNVFDTNSTDQVLIASVFTTADSSDEFIVSSTRLDDSPDTAVSPLATNVYGADHGLASTYFIFTENGFQDNGTTGNRAGNRDVMLGELRVSATGVTTVGAGTPLEIDAFNGLIDLTISGDADGAPIRDGSNGEVNLDVQSRISRSGTYIAVMWTQDNDDITDLNPTDAAVGALVPNDVPFVTVIQTRLDPADARELADSVPVDGPEQLGALESTFENVNSTGDLQGNAQNLKFQEGLAQGENQSAGSGEADRGCSFQGNHLRMSALFEQNEDVNGTTPDDTVLYLNSFTTTLGATDSDAPELDLTGVEEVDQLDQDYSLDFDAFAIDAGDATLTNDPIPVPAPQAGRVLVFFRGNANNPEAGGVTTGGDDGTVGNFAEPRLFVSEQAANGTVGARELVSSDPLAGRDDSLLLDELAGSVLVPVNEDTVSSPNHVGTTSFVFWTENANLPGSNLRLMTRSHSQAAATQAAPAVTLVDRFTPPLQDSVFTGSKQPVAIDNPTSGDLFDLPAVIGPPSTSGVFIGRDGSTVGVYFAEDQHIYFSDSSGTAADFDMENGVAAPQLVDNDADFGTTVVFFDVFFPPECNNLARSQVVFSRLDISLIVNGLRLWIRGHD